MVNLDAEANFKGNIFLTEITLTWEEVTAPLLTLKKKINKNYYHLPFCLCKK
jgi:hypothetical protein